MAAAVATMPSSTTSQATTDSNRTGRSSEAGPHGFTAVNGGSPHSTPPTSRETSPRYSNSGTDAHSPGKPSAKEPGAEHSMHKRKRSNSSEHSEASPPRQYDYNPPKRAEHHQNMADKALNVLDNGESHHAHGYYSTTPNGAGSSGYAYERPYNGPNHVPHGSMHEDRLQREGSDPHRYQSQPGQSEGEDQNQTGDDPNRTPLVPIGGKRKRNFSNRTKTGCLTCRQRKKKCDEARPTCNNCTRGGFSCLGYNNTRPGNWPKPAATKQPVPLQSKDNDDPHHYRSESEHTPVSAHPSSHEASQLKSGPADGHEQPRPSYVPNSQQSADGRPPYSGQTQPHWPQHPQPQQGQPPSYTAEGLPPFSDIARSDPQRSDYSHPSSRDMSRPNTQPAPPPTSSAAPAPSQWQHSGPPPPHQPTPSAAPPSSDYRHPPYAPPQQPPPAPARVASGSFGYDKPGSKVFSKEEIERSRMLRGVPYNYFDPTLKNERQRCAQALERYNNACRLGSGISDQEAKSMLMKVFDPSLDKAHSFLAPCHEKGILGPGVVVEGSFQCTYGYNIRVYDNVFIGEGTRIDDSAKVDIGARTWIGANVTILTNDVSKDMVQRKGTDGQKCLARSVEISSEVVIGEGAKIYPGVKIGRGATVEPWAVVNQHLAENMTQKCYIGPRMGGDPNATLHWDR